MIAGYKVQVTFVLLKAEVWIWFCFSAMAPQSQTFLHSFSPVTSVSTLIKIMS